MSIIVGLLVAISLAVASDPPPILDRLIKEEAAERHLSFLAADSLFGRFTLGPGLWEAAHYIADRFQQWGLQPLIDSSYFHLYALHRRFLVSEPQLEVMLADTSVIVLKMGRDFRPFYLTATDTLRNVPVVFAGYGLALPDSGYDDYEGVDVQGKAVVVLEGLPAHFERRWQRSGDHRRYGMMRYKVQAAAERGAVAVLSVRVRRQRVRLGGFPWELARRRRAPVMPVFIQWPVVTLSLGPKAVKTIFGSLKAILDLKRQIDSAGRPASMVLPSCAITVTLADSSQVFRVPNVVGVLRGTQRPEEYIVVGAHYDHLGIRSPSSPNEVVTDTICNGADDNASGTTGLLLLAKAFAQLPQPPKRSILFVAFSGEEMGLLGSKAFVADTAQIPIDAIIAMLNMDMIGRNHPDTLHVGGTSIAPLLRTVLEEENQQLSPPFVLRYDIEEFMRRSDQASFIDRRIPALFFFTGLHRDYHQVSDEVDKIDFSKLRRVTILVGRVLWRIAYSLDPIPFVSTSE